VVDRSGLRLTGTRLTGKRFEMAVIATFTYTFEPGRTNDFMAKLKEAAAPRFESE
jgi:hypothetical protein